MRIAQVAPLAEAVPPRLYGGTERVVSWLTEELVRQGHEVTLFASGDSETTARLVPCAPKALRLEGIKDHTAANLAMLARVREWAHRFDVIHFHTEFLHFPLFCDMAGKTVTTLHNRQQAPDFRVAYEAFPEMPLVSISDDYRRGMPKGLNWVATILHGIGGDEGGIFSPAGGDYLAFLGRMSPEKRPDRAIEIAVKAGMKLKLAAKVDPKDQAYYDKVVKPMLAHPLVEFVGEIGEAEKDDFLGRARALLFPIDWPEPFGLVMAEAMRVGTPVVAWAEGSVPEVIRHGVSGWVVDSVDEAVEAVRNLRLLSRREVRREFETRFTAARMAQDYVQVYRRLMWHQQPVVRAGQGVRPQGISRGAMA